MAKYSIRDLENFTGIKAHTLRIWEKRYKVVEPKRTDTNIRFYTDSDLKRLLNVSILNRNGYKISNIVNLSENDLNQKVLNIAYLQNDFESQIENLVVSMIDMDERKFDKVFDIAVINYGFENTILNLVYPFFQKVGILWQIGTINPAQEHFVSNLIRQKLIVAISNLGNKEDERNKVFVLFLPEGDFHELGLIFYHYLLKKNNYKVIYLGGSVPMDALNEVAKTRKVDYMVCSVINAIEEEQLGLFISSLSLGFPQVRKIFLTGLQTENYKQPLPDKIELVKMASEFIKQIKN